MEVLQCFLDLKIFLKKINIKQFLYRYLLFVIVIIHNYYIFINNSIILIMEYKQFAETDIQVSRIGFGTWGIGGNPENSLSYGETDDKESIRALDYALDNGINFFDTSPLYGFGHSEELLGTAFTSKRDKV